MNIDKIRKELKNKGKKKNNIMSKLLILAVLTLITMILMKGNLGFRNSVNKILFENHISFVKAREFYQNHFSKVLPEPEPVSKQLMNIDSREEYLDGVALNLKDDLVFTIDTGMVVFIGDKDNYNKTIIIENVDGVQTQYSNLDNTNLKMYDYVEEGELVGSTSKLYLVCKKDTFFDCEV